MIRITASRDQNSLLRNDLHGLLLTSAGFSCLMLLARMVYTGNMYFITMVWNLFLAFVPYFLSSCLVQRPAWIKSRWKFTLVLTVWVLFIPNSFYVLTDLFHLLDSTAVPLWYDLLLLVSFAWNALVFGILSVRQMEKITAALWPGMPGWAFLYPVMALNALGVYIGRYLRYNSWDVVADPFRLVKDMAHIMLHPVAYKQVWGMIVCFSFFLVIIYTTIKKVSHTLR